MVAKMRALIILFEMILSKLLCHLTSVDGTDNSGRITISSPVWKTANTGDYGKLQWAVLSGSFSNYTISKVGSAVIDSNTYQTYDIGKGVITLHFWNIQASNGGSYTLTVTPDPLLQTFVGSLFVYAMPYTIPIQNVGSNSPSLGSTIEVNCSATSYSLPPEKRPKVYYFWYLNAYGAFQNVSSGPAILRNGDPLPGYSIKNGGRTLVIASVKAQDAQGIYCSAQEYGSPFASGFNIRLPLNVAYRPYITQVSSGKYTVNADLSSSYSVYWHFDFVAEPAITFYTNWTLVNRTGYTRVFQLNNSTLGYRYLTLNTNLLSKEYYGNCSMTIGNTVGNTTVTVQVLERGTPDMPTNLTVLYTTHNAICLKWNCQLGNSDVNQTVLLALKDVAENTEIETRRIVVSDSCKNIIYQTVFRRDIQPDTLYQATIWSTNQLGSSGSSSINFKTQQRAILSVSPQTISIVVKSIIQSDALINVMSTYPDVAWLNVSCCVEETNECFVKSYNVFYSMNQIVFDGLPDGDEYVFDFTLFNGDFFSYVYVLAFVRGVRIQKIQCNTSYDQCSRKFTTTIPKSSPSDTGNRYFVAIVVLAVLLGIAVLGLIGCLVAYLVGKNRSSRRPRRLEQSSMAVRSDHPARRETTIDNSDSYYESMDAGGQYNHSYTSIDKSPPKPRTDRAT